jgi:hypothetical protein
MARLLRRGNLEDLRHFVDRYPKDEDNGWELQVAVAYNVDSPSSCHQTFAGIFDLINSELRAVFLGINKAAIAEAAAAAAASQKAF